VRFDEKAYQKVTDLQSKSPEDFTLPQIPTIETPTTAFFAWIDCQKRIFEFRQQLQNKPPPTSPSPRPDLGLTTGRKNFEAIYEYQLADIQKDLKAALEKNQILEKRINFILDQKANFVKKYKFFLSSHEIFIDQISNVTSKLTAIFYNLSDKKLKQFLSSKLVKNFENLELNFLSLHKSIKTYTDQTQIFELLQSLNFDDLHEYTSDCDNDSRNKTVSKISGSLGGVRKDSLLDSWERGVEGERETVKKDIDPKAKVFVGIKKGGEGLSHSGFDNDSFREKIRGLNIEKVHSGKDCYFGPGGDLGDWRNQCYYTDRSYNLGARKSEKSD
jgi:hypothetical protein